MLLDQRPQDTFCHSKATKYLAGTWGVGGGGWGFLYRPSHSGSLLWYLVANCAPNPVWLVLILGTSFNNNILGRPALEAPSWVYHTLYIGQRHGDPLQSKSLRNAPQELLLGRERRWLLDPKGTMLLLTHCLLLGPHVCGLACTPCRAHMPCHRVRLIARCSRMGGQRLTSGSWALQSPTKSSNGFWGDSTAPV